jgi:hypothetical protein
MALMHAFCKGVGAPIFYICRENGLPSGKLFVALAFQNRDLVFIEGRVRTEFSSMTRCFSRLPRRSAQASWHASRFRRMSEGRVGACRRFCVSDPQRDTWGRWAASLSRCSVCQASV